MHNKSMNLLMMHRDHITSNQDIALEGIQNTCGAQKLLGQH